jgi:hypothetical protein
MFVDKSIMDSDVEGLKALDTRLVLKGLQGIRIMAFYTPREPLGQGVGGRTSPKVGPWRASSLFS